MSAGIPLSMDADMVRNHIRTKMEALGMSQREYADMCGYDHTHLSRVLSGEKLPGKKILEAEDLKAVIYYEYKDLP
jgi:ribosome-binding protein aMBF1 (putative translation factor)